MVIRDGENGLLVPVGDDRELLYAMTRIADEDGLANRLCTSAELLREKLSVSGIADEWCREIGE